MLQLSVGLALWSIRVVGGKKKDEVKEKLVVEVRDIL
jgi:hypothetical protein